MDTENNLKMEIPATYLIPKRRKDRPKTTEAILQVSNDYSAVSTIHGIGYIGNRDHSNGGRVFWVLAVLIALACTILVVSKIVTQWLDQPILTNLDTVSWPAENIDFPAVTLCPQGSTADTMDKFFYNQFEEWLSKKIVKDPETIKRVKREGLNDNCGCHVPYFGNMSREDLQCCFRQFFDENFPGIYPNNPTKIASMMIADDPGKAIENKAIVLPDEEPKCSEKDNSEILNNVNEKLKQRCPNSYKKLNDSTCVIQGPTKASYNEALLQCKANNGGTILYLDILEDINAIENIFGNN